MIEYELEGTFGKKRVRADGWTVSPDETIIRFYINRRDGGRVTVAFFQQSMIYSVIDLVYKKK